MSEYSHFNGHHRATLSSDPGSNEILLALNIFSSKKRCSRAGPAGLSILGQNLREHLLASIKWLLSHPLPPFSDAQIYAGVHSNSKYLREFEHLSRSCLGFLVTARMFRSVQLLGGEIPELVRFTTSSHSFGRTSKKRRTMRGEWKSRTPVDVPTVSADHCVIRANDDKWETEDFTVTLTDTSSNGTYVNHERIPKGMPFPIKSGDCVHLYIPRHDNARYLEYATAFRFFVHESGTSKAAREVRATGANFNTPVNDAMCVDEPSAKRLRQVRTSLAGPEPPFSRGGSAAGSSHGSVQAPPGWYNHRGAQLRQAGVATPGDGLEELRGALSGISISNVTNARLSDEHHAQQHMPAMSQYQAVRPNDACSAASRMNNKPTADSSGAGDLLQSDFRSWQLE